MLMTLYGRKVLNELMSWAKYFHSIDRALKLLPEKAANWKGFLHPSWATIGFRAPMVQAVVNPQGPIHKDQLVLL